MRDHKIYPLIFIVALVALLSSLSSGCSQSKEKVPLSVFCAGSLILPFDGIEKAFESLYPEIDVQNECHGSIQVIRHVTELHKKIDIVATADHALIPMLMYPTINQETGNPYADWYIRFAGNRLVLAYSQHSKYADEITPENWYEIISRPDVKVGLSDPRFDASGYRTLMILKLAESYYGQKSLLGDVTWGKFSYPIVAFEEEGHILIQVPEILETKKDSNIVLRGSSIQLIALLQSGDLDYAFEYDSVIRQHQLEEVTLTDALNLGVESYADSYRTVKVKLDFQRFATVKPEFYGEPIGYGITIPESAPHPDEARLYIQFLLSPEGRSIMESYSHPILDRPICDHPENMPESLSQLCIAAP